MAKHTGPHIWCVDGCARTFFFPEAGQLLAGGVPLPDVTPDFDATLTHKHTPCFLAATSSITPGLLHEVGRGTTGSRLHLRRILRDTPVFIYMIAT